MIIEFREPYVILLGGLPGVGKTTYIKDTLLPWFEYIGSRVVICDSDSLIESKASELGISYREAWDVYKTPAEEEFKHQLKSVSSNRLNVVIDRTGLYPDSRRRMLSDFTGYNKYLIFLHTSEEMHRQRLKEREINTGKTISEDVMLAMKQRLKLVDKNEAKLFTSVIYLNA